MHPCLIRRYLYLRYIVEKCLTGGHRPSQARYPRMTETSGTPRTEGAEEIEEAVRRVEIRLGALMKQRIVPRYLHLTCT